MLEAQGGEGCEWEQGKPEQGGWRILSL